MNRSAPLPDADFSALPGVLQGPARQLRGLVRRLPTEPPSFVAARLLDRLLWPRGQDDADRLFFERALVMEGDTEFGLMIKNTLDAIGPLWPPRAAP